MTETGAPTRQDVDTARRAIFRPVLILLTGFLAVSGAMVAVLVALSRFGADIDVTIWIRCSLVLASSIVLLLLAVNAARGSRNACLRLRIISPVVVTAVIVIVSIPGFLPVWVRIEQGVCGALVLPVAILVNLPQVRAVFPRGA